MHQEINSPDISKVYACVFRPVKSPVRTLYKHISLRSLRFYLNKSWWCLLCWGNIYSVRS